MRGTVTNLWDMRNAEIPASLLHAEVDPQQVEQEIQNLSLRYAAQIPADTVEPGDIVACTATPETYPDGRTILLYTAMGIPGAEKAVAAVLGSHVDDCVTAELCGRVVHLTVCKIVRPIPAEVNDQLVASIGMDGITTVADYRAWLEEKKRADCQMENHKMAVRSVMEQMLAGSTFEYDETEVDRYLALHLDEIRAEYETSGMEMPEMELIRQSFLDANRQGWLAETFCQANGIEIDREMAETDADQMMEMMRLMGEPVPSREEMVENAVRDAYIMAMFERIDGFVTEKMGR